MKIFAGLLILLAASQAAQKGTSLLDANSLLKKLDTIDPTTAIPAKEGMFCKHLRDYADVNASLPPAISAARWLGLIDEAYAIPLRIETGDAPTSPVGDLFTVMRALPPPSVWPEIEKQVNSRPPSRNKIVLQLLFARLSGDDKAVARLCDQLESIPISNPYSIGSGKHRLTAVRICLARRLDDRKTLAKFAAQSQNLTAWDQRELPDLSLFNQAPDGNQQSSDNSTPDSQNPAPTEESAQHLEGTLDDSSKSSSDKHDAIQKLLAIHGRLGEIEAMKQDYARLAQLPDLPGARPSGEDYIRFGVAIKDKATIRKALEYESKSPYAGQEQSFIDAMSFVGDFAKAESIEEREIGTSYHDYPNQPLYNNGLLLCRLYYLANRPADVLDVLKNFRSWAGNDLGSHQAPYVENGELGWATYDRPVGTLPLSYYAAWALAKTGNRPLAVRTLKEFIPHTLDCDQMYELLNDLDGAAAIPFYDSLIIAHQFDSKPLFWKGELALKLGDLEESAEDIKGAVELDPENDSQIDRRAEPYIALSEILSKMGHTKDAAKYRDQAEAMQLAYRGFVLEHVGLLPQAERLFKQSLATYPSDYEIEVELAKCYTEEGRAPESKASYRKAYELLPLACSDGTELPKTNDHLFYDPEIRRIGKPVIQGFAVRAASDPRYAYVKGCFEIQEDELSAAALDLESAVNEDPRDYVAWKLLDSIAAKAMLPAALSRLVPYHMLDLTPAALDEFFLEGPDFSCEGNLANTYAVIGDALKRLYIFPAGPLLAMHSVPRSSWEPNNRDLLEMKPEPGEYFTQMPDIQDILLEYAPGG